MYNIEELGARKQELNNLNKDFGGYYSVSLAQEELLSSMSKLDKELRDLDYEIFKVKAVLEANKDP